MRVLYSLECDGDLELLDDVQWADWNRGGQLLVTTRCGKLQMRDLDSDHPGTVFEEDLSLLEPNPTPIDDYRDVSALCERFGIEIPLEYSKFREEL
jgi:hypothetical protein